jgi:2-polyprenyl-3-methyl-5-hydroxy-6-metoxy-1,4-benzoquinol methylase
LYGRVFAALARPRRAILKCRPFICPFEELLPYVPDGASVFDIGCGCGLFLLALAYAGKRISGVGVDTAPDAVRAATLAARTGEIEATGSTLSFEAACGAEAWPAGQFDVASLIDVLHHVPAAGQRAFVTAAVSRLKPGGVLIYKDMSRRPLWRAWANRLHDLVMARQWIRYREIAEVLEWAASLGLVQQSRRDLVRLWYGHELCVFRKADGG